MTDAGRQTETAARKHLRKMKDLRGEIRAGREDVIEREGNEKAMTRRENGLVKEESRKNERLAREQMEGGDINPPPQNPFR